MPSPTRSDPEGSSRNDFRVGSSRLPPSAAIAAVMSDSRYSPVKDRIASFLGKSIVVALVGTALTATIGAGLAVIPVIGLVGMLMAPLPTVAMYLIAVTGLYVLLSLVLAWCGLDGIWARRGALSASVSLALLTGWAIPARINHDAGVGPGTDATQQNWSAAVLNSPRVVAFVETDPSYFEPKCDAPCLSLLVTHRAPRVVVGSSKETVVRGSMISGTEFRLKGDWRRCVAQLPDYVMIVRSFPAGRRDSFLVFGLDPSFAAELPRCIEKRRVRFRAGVILTFSNWHSQEPEVGTRGALGWLPKHAEHQIFMPDGRHERREFKTGYRYGMPAMIWPYGGNAGTGGTFEPAWVKDRVSNQSETDRQPWWSMLAEGDAIANEAMSLLDAVIPERRCRRQHERCVLEPVGN